MADSIAVGDEQRRALAPAAVDALFHQAAQVDDEVRRGLILPLRRAIHNGRTPTVSRDQLLAAGVDAVVLAWCDAAGEGERQRADLAAAVAADLLADRERLQAALHEPGLLAALSMSSPTLARQALRYASTPLREHGKRQRGGEAKLARYAERARTKTTPFSCYTTVGYGRWRSGGAGLPDPSVTQRLRHVEPNHVLLRRLLAAALGCADVREAVGHRPAAGLVMGEADVRFDTLVDTPDQQPRVFTTRTVTSRVRRTALVDAVVGIAAAPAEAPTLAEIAAVLRPALPPAGRERSGDLADELVHRFAGVGLLVPDLGLVEQSPTALLDAEKVLRSLSTPRAAALADALERICALGEVVAEVAGADRPERYDELHVAWVGAFAMVDATLPSGFLLYEDDVLRDPVDLDPAAWGPALDDLLALLPALEPFNVASAARLLATESFVATHGQDGRCALADFATLLPQVFAAAGGELREVETALTAAVPEAAALFAARRPVLDLVRAGSGKVEMTLSGEVLSALSTATPVRFRQERPAYGLFVQPVTSGTGSVEQVVLNHVYGGHGQFTSRFLPFWDAGPLGEVRAHLRATTTAQTAEVRPVLGFNANLHPPLVDTQIDPGLGAPDVPVGDTIEIHELVVRHDSRSNRLVLERGDGTPVHPLYLGFLVPYLLPYTLSALYVLGDAGLIRCDVVAEVDAALSAAERCQVRAYPRLRAGRVVLSRRRWYVPRTLLPLVDRPLDEDLADLLLRMDRWRHDHGIPSEVFLTPRLEAPPLSDVDPGERFRLQVAATRAKPTYVDLRSPLHLRALASWLGEATTVQLEEVLPDPAHQVGPLTAGPRAVEYVIDVIATPSTSTLGDS